MNKSTLKVSILLALVALIFSTQNIFAAESDLETNETDKILEKAEKKAKAESKPSTIDELKELVDDGSFEKAYAKGQEMLFDFEGEPEFDLLYGTAAIEVGQNQEAAFIFERLTQADPTNVRYQLELGRVKYQMGEKEKAKAIFEQVLVSEQELPENVEARIMAYLNAISAGSEFGNPAKAESFKAFVGIAAGSDSNANGSSDIDTVARFTSFQGSGGASIAFPNPDEESTSYLAHQIALAYVKPLSERAALDFKVYGANQNNSNDDATESGLAFFEMGNRWRFEKGLAYFAIRATGVKLDHEDVNDSMQLSANWTQPVSWKFADSLDLGLSLGTVRYTQDDTKDINTTALNAGVTKQKDQFIHAVGLMYGADDAQGKKDFTDVDSTFYPDLPTDYYSRTYYGLNYSLSYLYNSKTVFHGGLLYQVSSYDEKDRDYTNLVPDGSGGTVAEFAKRDGNLTALVFGTRYNWNKNLQFKASATMMDVTSDLDFYEYSRNKFEVGAGYQL